MAALLHPAAGKSQTMLAQQRVIKLVLLLRTTFAVATT
jgi:hypothetical protein